MGGCECVCVYVCVCVSVSHEASTGLIHHDVYPT